MKKRENKNQKSRGVIHPASKRWISKLLILILIVLIVVILLLVNNHYGLTGKIIFSEPDYNNSGYAPPFDVFSNTDPKYLVYNLTPDVFVLGEDKMLTMNINVSWPNSVDGIVYKTALLYNSKINNWVSFNLNGDLVPGSNVWYNHSGSRTMTFNASGKDFIEGNNYLVTYGCKKVSGAWKCGCYDNSGNDCDHWMMQVFNVTNTPNLGSNLTYCVQNPLTDCLPDKICVDGVCVVNTSAPVAFSCNQTNSAGFYNGSGTLSSPYGICNCSMLQNMRGGYGISSFGVNYILLSDIDCSDTKNWNSGQGFMPLGDSDVGYSISPFQGSLEGKNFKIINLYINNPYSKSVGLFSSIASGASVSNLKLVDVNISSNNWKVGGLIGALVGSRSTAPIILGCNVSSCKIINVSVSGNIKGSSYSVGGLIGGGTTGDQTSWLMPEGITIKDSYFIGTISGTSYIGGLIGFGAWATGCNISLTNSYSSSKIVGSSDLGGLIGLTGCGSVANSFWDKEVSGTTISSGGGTGKTTAEMKNQGNYTNWDFTNTWAIDSAKNNGYPYLRWQNL